MKKFLFNSFLLIIFIFLMHLIFSFFSDGSTDNFYLRLTSEKQNSMILGTSRSAQGINPSVIDTVLKNNYDMYNFSFSVNNSSFGKVYYDAISSKINKNITDGIFIITVDPWSISSKIGVDTNMIDNNSILKKISNYNVYPNYHYLIKNYSKGWGSILLKKIEYKILLNKSSLENFNGSFTFLQNDGLLRVYTNMDSTYVKINTKIKINYYKNYMSKNVFSKHRYNYLDKTINLLKMHGDVFLIRMPIDNNLYEIENSIFPKFNNQMKSLSKKHDLKYLNYTNVNDKFRYTDGNHLYYNDAINFSNNLANDIKNHLK
tara:strand:+ start:642 stop:1592 length:951 start_codon:yes stop_codon:yes gene_type:complete